MARLIFSLNKCIHDEHLKDILFFEKQLKFFRELKVRNIYNKISKSATDIIKALNNKIKYLITQYNNKYSQSMTRRKIMEWGYEHTRRNK